MKPKIYRERTFWKRIAANATCAVLLVIVGILGAHAIENVSKDLRNWDWVTVAFAISLPLYIALQTYVFFAAEERADDAQHILLEKSKELQDLMTTLPPKSFLSLYAERSVDARRLYDAISALNDSPQSNEIALAIRATLFNIIEMVKVFDEISPTERVGANIMILKRPDDYNNDPKCHTIQDNLIFAEQAVSIHSLFGVLVVAPELSATDISSNVDPAMKDVKFVLPVPTISHSTVNRKYTVLPGAPLAALIGLANGYGDVASLELWFETEGDFSDTISKQVADYFKGGEGRDILSFWNVPPVLPC